MSPLLKPITVAENAALCLARCHHMALPGAEGGDTSTKFHGRKPWCCQRTDSQWMLGQQRILSITLPVAQTRQCLKQPYSKTVVLGRWWKNPLTYWHGIHREVAVWFCSDGSATVHLQCWQYNLGTCQDPRNATHNFPKILNVRTRPEYPGCFLKLLPFGA